VPSPPVLSAEERIEALAKAAEARRKRAHLKAELKKGNARFEDLLRESASDEAVAKMRVCIALESLPGVGKVRAKKLMDKLGIASTRRVGGQKESLLRELP